MAASSMPMKIPFAGIANSAGCAGKQNHPNSQKINKKN
jgi:hypothetical protein